MDKVFKGLFMKRIYFYCAIFLSVAGMVRAITPMDYYNSLVAGGGSAGYADGAFAVARFNIPTGLAFDDSGHKLYIADSANNRIRVICLDQNNLVKTLAGTDAAGAADGPVSTASFFYPTLLASLPGNRLAVFDSGNSALRLVNLETQQVSTLIRGYHLRDMAYRPKDDSLYFSDTDTKRVERLDLKTSTLSTVFSDDPRLPSPAALCIFQDNLCVADRNLPAIYEVIGGATPPPPAGSVTSAPASAASPTPTLTPTPIPATFTAVGNANNVIALSSSDGFLYALDKDGQLVKVGLSDSKTVDFPTPWGFLFKNKDHGGVVQLLNVQRDIPPAFLASPSEARKFYVSTNHSIISIKDYDFEKHWSAIEDNTRDLTDFNYPVKKPAGTFRILTVGASRNSTVVPIPSDPAAPIVEDSLEGNFKVKTYTKILEFMLNTEAALRNSPTRFEVLNLTRRGVAINTFANYELLDAVKKYDVDMVLGLADFSGYWDYYEAPLTGEGIPASSSKTDYLKKPLSERAPAGAASDLIDRFKKLKLGYSEKQDYPGEGEVGFFCNNDAQLQNDLEELTGRRFQLLSEKFKSIKTSEGSSPHLILFYVPSAYYPNDCYSAFWSQTCARFQVKFLDLSESYNALRISYYPSDVMHITAYGNELIARLLDFYLTDQKLIPLQPGSTDPATTKTNP